MKGKFVKTIKRWAPLVLWIVIIFGLSSVPDISGKGISFPAGTDKVVHFLEYAVLALLLYRGAAYGKTKPGISRGVISLFVAAGIALMDEYYQSFIPGRDASFLDLMADLLGIITGNAVYYFFRATSSRRYRRE